MTDRDSLPAGPKPKHLVVFACFAALLFTASQKPCLSFEEAPESSDAAEKELDDLEALGAMSIEELMEVEVTLASRTKGKSLQRTAAAIYVISKDEIRLSGLTTLPELLRLVPGFYVGRSDAHDSVVTARGFANKYSNKLLVMMDGRTLYTPNFGGVMWDMQDVVLEDVERIEVIRGPGATLWGANAVNGIINIITKNAKDSQGFAATGAAGDELRGLGSVRYGGQMGEKSSYRLHGKGMAHDGQWMEDDEYSDDWRRFLGGFKMDWDDEKNDAFTLQGDYHQGRFGEIGSKLDPAHPAGGESV